MLGFYISLPFLLFTVYRLLIVLYNYFTKPFLPIGTPNGNPLISISFFAHDSEKSIGRLLQGLINQTYKNFEVLIYNDQSSDRTVSVINEIVAGDTRFRLFCGNDVPNGWQRINYAYDKLSQLSKGQYIAFINSNIIVDKQLFANAIAHAQGKNLSALMLYPKKQSQRISEKIQISALQWMLYSLVFVKTHLKRSTKDSTIPNNPLLIVEASSYQTNRWHEKFKDTENPEIKIVNVITGLQLNCDSLMADNRLAIEFYHSNTENINNLSKSLLGFLKSRNGLITFTIATTLGPILAIFLLPFPLVFLYFFSIIYGRMLVALLCQESVIASILLLPIQHFMLMKLAINTIKTIRQEKPENSGLIV